LISVLQTTLTKRLIDENKLLAKIHENQKKPVKKSGFAHRLEMAAKEQNKLRAQAQSTYKKKPNQYQQIRKKK
jgi:YidC/Oxa1 family membrane protein insertase